MYTTDNVLFENLLNAITKGKWYISQESVTTTKRVLSTLVAELPTVVELQEALAEAESFNLDAEEAARNEARQKKSEMRQSQRELLNERCAEWAKNNLKVGMMVRLTGTRDKSGIRKIIDLDEDHIVGRQWAERRVYSHDGSGNRKIVMEMEELASITTNKIESVRQVQIEGEWHKVVDLLKGK